MICVHGIQGYSFPFLLIDLVLSFSGNFPDDTGERTRRSRRQNSVFHAETNGPQLVCSKKENSYYLVDILDAPFTGMTVM